VDDEAAASQVIGEDQKDMLVTARQRGQVLFSVEYAGARSARCKVDGFGLGAERVVGTCAAAGEARAAKLEAAEDVDGVLLEGARVDGGLQYATPGAVVAVSELDVGGACGQWAAECAVGTAFVWVGGGEVPAAGARQLPHLVKL